MRARLLLWGALGLIGLAIPAPAAAQHAQGTGQQASELFHLESGLATFALEHSGSGPFSVRLLDEDGVVVERLAEAEGPFQGSKAVRIPRAGLYLYDVSATGPWVIRLREPRAAGAAHDPDARIQGMQAARGVGTMPWLATGLLGGSVLGPIGAGIGLAIASSRETTVPGEVLAGLDGREPAYREAFREGYRAKLRSNRRTAAIVGGATGSLIFGFIVLQIANWDGGDGGNPPGGGGDLP